VILENFFVVEVLLFSLWFGFCFFGAEAVSGSVCVFFA